MSTMEQVIETSLIAPLTAAHTEENTSKMIQESTKKAKTIVGKMFNGLITLVMVAVLALAGASTVVPRLMGAVPLTVLSGSMMPTYRPGDLVIVRPTPVENLEVGDVITFQAVSGESALITHRLMAITTNDGEIVSLVTQGDANPTSDRYILPGQVMGRVVYSVPFVGQLRSPRNALILSGVIGLSLMAYAVTHVVRKQDNDGEGNE